MPNDDLGTFPTPQQASAAQAEPVVADAPVTPATPPAPEAPAFEETPEEIPSFQSSTALAEEHDKLVAANENLIQNQTTPIVPEAEPVSAPQTPQPAPEPVAATLPAKSKSAAPIIIVILLIIAGIGLAAAAYLSAQSNKLKVQLLEITKTLEKQETTLTPTATPTVFQIPTPTMATQSAVATSSATPSVTPTTFIVTDKLTPLANAASVLKIAINHSPSAQLLLIKVDKATDPANSVTKYFFREDMTTKKYFFISITGKGLPELIDKQIYVNPDNNIPSLNDAVLSNKMGMELDEVLKLTYAQCANQAVCTSATVNSMYIKTGTGIIWQLSLYPNDSTTPLLIQINSETKAIVYKSPEFANK